jgi:predicted nucleic acid-binding protein
MSAPVAVLDASVGAKWFKDELGTQEALELLIRHRDGELLIVVPSMFIAEVVAVVRRDHGPETARETWERLAAMMIVLIELDDRVAQTALDLCESTGMAFYDALSAALAQLLDAPLYSADRRAHGGVAGARIIG